MSTATFNVASFMGMIMIIGIAANNGILLLDAEHHFRDLGFSLEAAMIQRAAADCDDCTCNSRWDVAAGLRHWRWITNGATSSHSGDRLPAQFNGFVSGVYTCNSLLPRERKRETDQLKGINLIWKNCKASVVDR